MIGGDERAFLLPILHRFFIGSGFLEQLPAHRNAVPVVSVAERPECVMSQLRHDENVRLVQAGSLRLDPLITHVLPLGQINQAMRIRSKQPETSMKVVIECAE